MDKSYTIVEVSPDNKYLSSIRKLFLEYARSLNFSLQFQNFQAELDELPGLYSPPRGGLFLALVKNEPVGCVALKPLKDQICEMKRLYVRPSFRGLGIGKGLVIHVISQARERWYDIMRLDTISSMKEAIALYRSLGFEEIQPYYINPVEGAHYMELKLR